MVTVIIPVYNGEQTLARCIDSALEQDYPAIELIVIDNASTDGTESIARRYGERIRYIRNESNLGLARSYTKALFAAGAELVVYLQSDCAFAQRDYVTRILRHFDDPTVGAVTGKSIVDDFRALTWSQRLFAVLNLNDVAETRETGVHEISFVEARCDAFRTRLLREIGGFNAALTLSNEDQDLSIKIRRKGFRLLQDRSLRFYLGYGGTQDSFWKLLLKQHQMGRGQGFIFHRYRLESAAHSTRSLNRVLRAIHRGSQILLTIAGLLLALLAMSGSGAALVALLVLVAARAVYYVALGLYYWKSGCRGPAIDLLPLVPTGLVSDVVYGGSFFYGMAKSALRMRV
jgi:GT2 family glycosyltransferase